MTEADYRSSLKEIRARIASGTAEDLRCAEDGLAELRSVYPKRLSYIAAEVALMLAKGTAPEDCRNVIDYVVQEFCPQEGLDGAGRPGSGAGRSDRDRLTTMTPESRRMARVPRAWCNLWHRLCITAHRGAGRTRMAAGGRGWLHDIPVRAAGPALRRW